jgi:hypothetical protein
VQGHRFNKSLSSAAQYGGDKTLVSDRPRDVTPINEEDSGQLSAKQAVSKTAQERHGSCEGFERGGTIDDIDVCVDQNAAVTAENDDSAIRIVQ